MAKKKKTPDMEMCPTDVIDFLIGHTEVIIANLRDAHEELTNGDIETGIHSIDDAREALHKSKMASKLDAVKEFTKDKFAKIVEIQESM